MEDNMDNARKLTLSDWKSPLEKKRIEKRLRVEKVPDSQLWMVFDTEGMVRRGTYETRGEAQQARKVIAKKLWNMKGGS